jgi:NAD(P)-dependent dehydrogenase (short-subunit alcohol dehydrogenase family)
MTSDDFHHSHRHSPESEPARIAVITGGNAGLGFACAANLLTSNDGIPWRVIAACRNPERAQEAVARLTRVAGDSGRVQAMELNLASLASVRAFASALAARVSDGAISPISAMVCNAGVQSGTERTFTKDGFETTFGVNHLGHFLLVNLVQPLLAPHARIAIVSSSVHDPAQKAGPPPPAWNNPEALARGELGSAAAGDGAFTYGQRLYTTSKLANIYFTYGLARRLRAGLAVNAFDPGMMPGTGLVRDAPAPIRLAASYILPHMIPLLRRVMSPNVHTPAESGAALARLVTDPALAGVTGKYFEGLKEIRSSIDSYDDVRVEDLWRVSEMLTTQPEPSASP